MLAYERILIDPPGEIIPRLCEECVASIGGWDRLRRTPPLDHGFLRQLHSTKEGAGFWWQDRNMREELVGLVIAWWTDAIGRKHIRFAAGDEFGVPDLVDPSARPKKRADPLALIYPDVCVLRRSPAGPQWLALCGCGLFDAPAKLGWMGLCCAACHDRREEGIEFIGLRAVLKGHAHQITSIAFLADGNGLAAADEGGVWAVWDIRSGCKLHADATRTQVTRLAGADPPRRELVVRRGIDIDLIDPTTNPPHIRPVALVGSAGLLDMALSPNGQFVALLRPEFLNVHDREGRKVTSAATANLLEGPLVFSPDSQLLAVRLGRQVAVLELGSHRFQEPIELPGEWVVAQAFAPDGRTLALALSGKKPRVALWDHKERVVLRAWQLQDNDWFPANRLLFHPNGRTLLATASNRLVAWDIPSGIVLGDLAACVPLLSNLALSPDGRLVATTAGNTIRLWPIEMLVGGGT
jgi:WD40 repeat protein